ncbi:MAG: hypothetical protein WA615_02800 [Bradyrhizobium sp.]|jgi:hypothetical protein|uniref:hypothetical protein n=1 Tax=Bradyrhizobium sp. TaxID=376 RepID=UPI003C7A8C8A
MARPPDSPIRKSIKEAIAKLTFAKVDREAFPKKNDAVKAVAAEFQEHAQKHRNWHQFLLNMDSPRTIYDLISGKWEKKEAKKRARFWKKIPAKTIT